MKKRNEGFSSSLIVELLCCLLGSCAFCTALLPAMGQEVSMTECMLFAAVDLSVIFLLSRRWWLAPALIAAVAILGFGAVWVFKLKDPILDYVNGFIDWYNDAYPYTLPYSENGSQFLVHLAFSFPVTLVLYVYFRRLAFLPVWILLSGALLVWLYYAGAENMLTVAALLLIVLFVLICRTNARSINRKLGRGEKIPVSAMLTTAMVLAPLAVLFAFAFGPKEEGAWQSKSLVNFVEDLGDVFSFYGEGTSSGGSFDLSYSGLSPNGFELGGNIEPNNKNVLRVKTDTPILLAGSVYDTYNGYGWYDGWALGRFRFDSPLWKGKRREIFTIDKPSSNQASGPYNKITKSALLDINMNVNFRSLFAGGKLERVTLQRSDDTKIYFNTQGELYALEFPPYALSYSIRTRVFDREQENFDWNMHVLLKYASASKDREYEEIAERYTQVSETIEPYVAELVEAIIAGSEDDYDKALAIETWIRDNCTYTQTPGDAPGDRDFLSYFLESREGYCTYYATAMTLMARIAGLPARYVTGYGLKQADRVKDTTSYVATNATAHAWSQVYFYGVGWVDFDPTHWNFYELVTRDEPVEEEKPKPTPKPDVPEMPEPELPEPELPEPETDHEPLTPKKKDNTGKILLIILGCDLAAFLIFLLVRFILLFFRVENFYRRLNRRYPDNASRADVCYRQILKQLGFLGLEMQPSDTIQRFCARADEALAGDRARYPLETVCEPVVLSRFALREPTDGEVRRMCDYYIFLERTLRKKLGIRSYILHRMILGR